MNAHQRKLVAAVSLCTAVVVPNIASAVAVSGQGTWETTLQGRDLDGNMATFEAYYDTVLDITWLADANAGAGSAYDDKSYEFSEETTTDGRMTWSNANDWATTLNPYGSDITGWRLPTVSPIDGTTADDLNLSYIGSEDNGYNVSAPGTLYAGSTASEMAHMFYTTLGDKGYCNPATSTVSSCSGPQAGWGLSNTGPFSNFQSDGYWSATNYTPDIFAVWGFNFNDGGQLGYNKPSNFYAWAVHTGDVGASVVPVPAAAWLFGSGLLGLVGMGSKCRC